MSSHSIVPIKSLERPWEFHRLFLSFYLVHFLLRKRQHLRSDLRDQWESASAPRGDHYAISSCLPRPLHSRPARDPQASGSGRRAQPAAACSLLRLLVHDDAPLPSCRATLTRVSSGAQCTPRLPPTRTGPCARVHCVCRRRAQPSAVSSLLRLPRDMPSVIVAPTASCARVRCRVPTRSYSPSSVPRPNTIARPRVMLNATASWYPAARACNTSREELVQC